MTFSRSCTGHERLSSYALLLLFILLITTDTTAKRFRHRYNVTSLNGLKRGKRYIVEAIGPARCMYGDRYTFQVYPADSDKLLIFFRGGGLCWNKMSVNSGHCNADIVNFYPIGMLDRSRNSKSKFRDYTLIVVEYCSGDALIGSATEVPYRGKDGQRIQHLGALNTLSVVDWVTMLQSSGSLASILSDLVLLGASAGCIGTYMWSPKLLHTIKWKNSAVFLDGIMISLPPGYFREFLHSLNGCQFLQYFISPEVMKRCEQPDFSTSELIIETLKHNPDVPYVFMVSKRDYPNHMFYNHFGMNGHYMTHPVTARFVYDQLNSQFIEISSETNNFVAFVVNGDEHVFTNRDRYFIMNASNGISSNGTNDADSHGPIGIQEYLEQFPLRVGQQVQSICLGTEVDRIVSDVRAGYEYVHGDPALEHCGEVIKGRTVCFKKFIEEKEMSATDPSVGYCLRSIVEGTYTQIPHQIQMI